MSRVVPLPQHASFQTICSTSHGDVHPFHTNNVTYAFKMIHCHIRQTLGPNAPECFRTGTMGQSRDLDVVADYERTCGSATTDFIPCYTSLNVIEMWEAPDRWCLLGGQTATGHCTRLVVTKAYVNAPPTAARKYTLLVYDVVGVPKSQTLYDWCSKRQWSRKASFVHKLTTVHTLVAC